ncbi:MAG: LamG domain-containing protein, partial [Nitrosarchaeum sp.]
IEPINQTSIEPINQTSIEPINQTSIEPINQTSIEPINQTSVVLMEISPQIIEDFKLDNADNVEILGDIKSENKSEVIFDGGQIIENDGDSTKELLHFTISSWVKPDYDKGSADFTIISKEKIFALGIHNVIPPPKTAWFTVFDGIKWNTVSSSTEIGEEWTNIVATYDGSLIRLYVNGNLENTLDISIPYFTIYGKFLEIPRGTIESDSELTIGGTHRHTADTHEVSNLYSGKINEILLLNSTLTDEQISAEYAKELPQHQSLDKELSIEELTEIIRQELNQTSTSIVSQNYTLPEILEPTITTDLQEPIHQFQSNLVERGINFERYYLGDGQYELHLGKPVWVQTENGFAPWDVKETGNSFKIRNGLIGFEIDKETGDSKYSDPSTQQVAVSKETWIVQKFIDNAWITVGIEQQIPSIAVTSNQTGVFVTVTKTLQNTGQLVILYEIKEGESLKSTATFTNYGNTDQFRVLQSWQGVDSDEIEDEQGKQKMDKDKSSRVSDKKESEFKFIKNGKNLLEHDQSRASDSFVGYDIHSNTKQIDWVFENPVTFTLDNGESLVIDPTTAALTAVTSTGVGIYTNSASAAAVNTDDTTYQGGTGNANTRITAGEGPKLSGFLDGTMIPAGATIDKVQVDLLGGVISTGSATFDAILFTDPATPTTIGSTITSTSMSGVTPSFTTVSFGSTGLADWGSPALTEANVDNTNFGVRILVNTLTTTNGAQIDLVTMTVTYTVSSAISLTDNLGITDSVAKTKSTSISLTENLGITDSVAKTKSTSISLTENLGITDSVAKTRTAVLSLTENLGITDSVAKTKSTSI